MKHYREGSKEFVLRLNSELQYEEAGAVRRASSLKVETLQWEAMRIKIQKNRYTAEEHEEEEMGMEKEDPLMGRVKGGR